MPRYCRSIFALLSVLSSCLPAAVVTSRPGMPLRFEAETGSPDIFLSRGAGAAFRVDASGLQIFLPGASQSSPVTMSIAGGKRTARGKAFDLLPVKSHYLLGSTASRWRTNVPSFARVAYRQVYPGIDIVYYGTEGQLEFDFRVAAGAGTRAIRLAFGGIQSLKLDAAGDLVLETADGNLRQHKPRLYQASAGGTREIAGRYVLLGGNIVGIEAGPYDPARELVVDPVLTYATFAGGTKNDTVSRIATDSAGNMYVLGRTASTDLPLSKTPFQKTNAAQSDFFISKYDNKGALVFATYLGGNGTELPAGIGVDKSGNIWIAGTSDSDNLPLSDKPYQPNNRGGYLGVDACLFKLDPTGSKLLYATYFGGNSDDLAMAMTVDNQGAVYLTGASASDNFPITLGAFQKGRRFLNAFVSKFNPDGTLGYSTFVGGSKSDIPGGIVVDSAGNAYVAGDTSSTDFPTTPGAYQTLYKAGETDLFVFKLNSQGSNLIYSTFIGGAGEEYGYGLALDGAGNAYVSGKTTSSNFPVTTGALKRDLSGPSDAYVAKLDPSGSRLVFCTLLGGTREETAYGIAADKDGYVYVAGWTSSTNFPVAEPFQQASPGGSDAFVVKLDPAGTKVVEGSLLGGSGGDGANGMAFDGINTIYLAGDTDSTDFPATRKNSAQAVYGGGAIDGFVAAVSFSAEFLNLAVTPDKLAAQALVDAPAIHLKLAVSCAAGSTTPWTVEVTSTGGNWLSAAPRSGSGAAALDVVATLTGLAPGTYNGFVTIINQATSARAVVPVTVTLTSPAGQVAQNGIVNAASGLAGAVAPGEIVVLSGSGLGPDSLVRGDAAAPGGLETSLAETRVLFDGVPAPLMYVSAGRSSAIVPYEVAGKENTQVQVEFRSVKSATVPMRVAACAPGIYTADLSGKGLVGAINEDGSANSPANPAPKGSVVTFYATGEGQTEPAGINGKLAKGEYPKPVLPVALRIGGAEAELLYFGAAPDNVAGMFQVNARIPREGESGELPVLLTVGDCSGQPGVTIAVQ